MWVYCLWKPCLVQKTTSLLLRPFLKWESYMWEIYNKKTLEVGFSASAPDDLPVVFSFKMKWKLTLVQQRRTCGDFVCVYKWDLGRMFFKEKKLDTVKTCDTTKEGNWSECLSVMCHLLWSSHPTLISGIPVYIGAISCMIVCSCWTRHAWEKAVSFTPPGRHSWRTSSEAALFPLLGVGHSAGFASFSIYFLLS